MERFCENVYGLCPNLTIGNLTFEVESIYNPLNELYLCVKKDALALHLCNPELECDADLSSLSDANIAIIRDFLKKQFNYEF